jgi:molybdenum cofactor cytidylyltransferase
MDSGKKIVVLLLAAGSSSRLGSSKQLLNLNGETLIARTIKTSLASDANKTIVVLGADAKSHQKAVNQFPVDVIINVNWMAGIGNSIKTGLRYLMNTTDDAVAVIIIVCDQPMLSSELINTLIRKYQETGKTIIASHYGESDGVPALFEQSHFIDLLALPDERGAKTIIQTFSQHLERVEFPQGQFDIDTQEDYERFLNN